MKMSPEAASQQTRAPSPADPPSEMPNEPSTSSDEISQSGTPDFTSQGVTNDTAREVLASRPSVPPQSSTNTGQPDSQRAPAPVNTSNSPGTESGFTGRTQSRQREQRSEDARRQRWLRMRQQAMLDNLCPYDQEAIHRQGEKNVMRIKVFIKLGPSEQFVFTDVSTADPAVTEQTLAMYLIIKPLNVILTINSPLDGQTLSKERRSCGGLVPK
ncbi:hypothetical protein CDV36_000355 [Fusarium kuroshium]|uniref:Uncharacterized protein n=1 Tax=Fusarium kuroshium TaxID=2010991 RepID=A0A3M2SQV5_9HYPO|nr:hypothetical protein CDV36_000355 [Fusarium kuroshium]